MTDYGLVMGYGGDDWIELAGLVDSASGGDGNDLIDARHVQSNSTALTGGGGNDRLLGSDGTDEFNPDFGGGAEYDHGHDTMAGGKGDDRYTIYSGRDVVLEASGQGTDTVLLHVALDTYRMPANVEKIDSWGGGTAKTVIGNALSNEILTGSTQYGLGGNDTLSAGADHVKLRGGDGADILSAGGYLSNDLVGGRGHDTFQFSAGFTSFEDPNQQPSYVIRPGDCAVAFEGAGRAAGDRIDAVYLGSDFDVHRFILGDTGEGHLSLINQGQDTLVRGNIDSDANFEFQLLIKDGSVLASAYTAADFVLG